MSSVMITIQSGLCVPLCCVSRLVTVNTIKVPEGIDWAAVCKDAMDTYAVEIAGGLGPSVGKVWRVGLMGVSNTVHKAPATFTGRCASTAMAVQPAANEYPLNLFECPWQTASLRC